MKPLARAGGYERLAYCNADTGVDFTVTVVESLQAVRFEIDALRPHVAALEAAREIEAFAAAINCDGAPETLADHFYQNWRTAAVSAYRGISMRPPSDALIAPEAMIDTVWRWNLTRDARQEELGESYFLPRIGWAKRRSGAPIVYAAWIEDVATALPACLTHVLVARRARLDLSGGVAGAFAQSPGAMDARLTPFAEIAALAGAGWASSPERMLTLEAGRDAPASLKAAFAACDPAPLTARPIPPNRVLSASIMAQIKGTTTIRYSAAASASSLETAF